MCDAGLTTQCETTQVRDEGTGAALFGYSKLYGPVPGGQAEYLRVPHAQYTTIKVPDGPPDDRFVYLSDVLPTAWQAVQYADVPEGGTRRRARARADRRHVPRGSPSHQERRGDRRRSRGRAAATRARRAGRRDDRPARADDDLGDVIRAMTDGRGPDSVIDAVGMEAHGAPVAQARPAAGRDPARRAAGEGDGAAGIDRLTALHPAIDIVRRGGTISIIGVYGGAADPLPMMTLFDKQIQLRMGQANVKRWVDDILPLLTDDDPLGVDDFATHRLPSTTRPRPTPTSRPSETAPSRSCSARDSVTS